VTGTGLLACIGKGLLGTCLISKSRLLRLQSVKLKVDAFWLKIFGFLMRLGFKMSVLLASIYQ